MKTFKLPFEEGSLKLTVKTLKKYAPLNLENYKLLAKTRKISFDNEILTIGVAFPNEDEEKVYLNIQFDHLQIGCSVDTDETYLGLYAYTALEKMISYNQYYNFEEFYWPGFFEPKSGKSIYLNILNDRLGMDIELKSEYSPFYKPGHKLFYPKISIKELSEISIELIEPLLPCNDLLALGYCFVNPSPDSIRPENWPILIPYLMIPQVKGKSVRKFISFISIYADMLIDEYPDIQAKLNSLCCRMKSLAPIAIESDFQTADNNDRIRQSNIKNRDQLYFLWKQAVPKLIPQPFIHYLNTYSLKYVKGKPSKKYMQACKISAASPKLYFSIQEKGDFYELKLLFKVKNQVFSPDLNHKVFFISSIIDPLNLYFLSTLQDVDIVAQFAKYEFCMSILKCHYHSHFKRYKEKLEACYEFI
ncbi:hypothetical protein [Pedobacter suwonensis]|uniref:hypothetical protein n=1 Tax=Pedobacter suwonensis TaxID=332999 RepID=UPI003692B1D7